MLYCRYVVHNPSLPEHALCAVKILCGVTRSPLVQPKIVGLFTATEVCAIKAVNQIPETKFYTSTLSVMNVLHFHQKINFMLCIS